MRPGDRYALVGTNNGALMLDIVSGALVELNEAAKFIWQLALSGQPESTVVAALARRYGIDLDRAARHVNETLSTPFAAQPDTSQGDLHYERRGAEYVFVFRGHDVLAVDDRGDRIRLFAAPHGVSLAYLLQAVAPKVLALRGHTVLHASAVAMHGRVFAFSGLSGAGKTSTARAFAQAGARLVSEDKLLVYVRETETVAAAVGEASIAHWVESAARTLGSSKYATCSGLAIESELLPFVEIGFVDVRSRTAGPFASRFLSETETAGATFRNTFYGSDLGQDWIRHLHTAAHLGRTLRGFELTVPDGLDRLAEAAAALVRGGSLAAV